MNRLYDRMPLENTTGRLTEPLQAKFLPIKMTCMVKFSMIAICMER